MGRPGRPLAAIHADRVEWKPAPELVCHQLGDVLAGIIDDKNY